MQWRPGDQGSQQRRAPLRGVLEALQAKAQPWLDRQPDFARPAYGSVINSGADMLPGVGDLVGLEDLGEAARNNDPLGIGLGLLSAIPGLPAVGGAARRGARKSLGLMDATPAPARPVGLMGVSEADAALARYQAANPTDTGARVLTPGDEGYPTNAQWDEASQAYVAPRAEPEKTYPIRAYHGSPHSFDRFSMDAIGTGEGAQAYGHGLYFAESEDVARQYRDTLAGPKSYQPRDGMARGADKVGAMMSDGKDFATAVDDARWYFQRQADDTRDLLSWYKGPNSEATARQLAEAEQALAELDTLTPDAFDARQPGSMYEVGIDADPNAFIDYDAPLSQQPDHIRRLLGWQETPAVPPPADRELSDIIKRALKQAEGDASQVGLIVDNDGDLYRRASAHAERMGYDASEGAGDYVEDAARDYLASLMPNEVSGDALMALYRGREQELAAAGVPGVRYRDGFSRGPNGENGTSNYVLFSDELVKVLRKYGISGLGLGLGGASLASQGEENTYGL